MFPLTSEQLNGILAAALSNGGEYADIFIEDTRISSMVLQDSAVSQAQQVCLYGAGRHYPLCRKYVYPVAG